MLRSKDRGRPQCVRGEETQLGMRLKKTTQTPYSPKREQIKGKHHILKSKLTKEEFIHQQEERRVVPTKRHIRTSEGRQKQKEGPKSKERVWGAGEGLRKRVVRFRRTNDRKRVNLGKKESNRCA